MRQITVGRHSVSGRAPDYTCRTDPTVPTDIRTAFFRGFVVVNFVAGDQSWWSRSRWWRVPVALVVTILLSVCGIFWLAGIQR